MIIKINEKIQKLIIGFLTGAAIVLTFYFRWQKTADKSPDKGDLIFGIIFLSLGLAGLLAWLLGYEDKVFHHLKWYKKTHGEGLGISLHVLRYVALPIILGLLMIYFT